MSLSSLLQGRDRAQTSESGGRASSGRPVVVTRSEAGEEREESLADALPFRVGRVLYGGVLAFMALDNLRNLEERVGYAEHGGAPRPDVTVPAISLSLLLGSVGVALWRLPALAASGVAAFFLGVTPIMHDFWAIDDPEEAQGQQLHFLKNTALLGASLVFLALGLDRER